MDRRLRTLRCVGLVSTGFLALGAYLAGALPAGDPGARLRRFGWAATPPSYRIGIAICLVGAVGWLIGWRRLAAIGDHRGTRWMVVTGLLWTLPLLLAPPLASRDVYSYVCQGWLYATGDDPYTVGAAEGACPWLVAVSPMWRHTTTPYGPLAIALSGGAARTAEMVPVSTQWQLVIAMTLLRLAAAAGMTLAGWSAYRLAQACGANPTRAVWLGAITPLMALHAVSAAHNDALLAGLVVVGLAATAARPATAAGAVRATAAGGVALGLAATIKITAVIALPFALLLAVSYQTSTGRRPWGRALVGVGATAAATFGLMTAVTGLGWGWINALKDTATAIQWTSVPTAAGICAIYVLRMIGRPERAAFALALARGAGMATLAAAGIALWITAVRSLDRPRTIVACCGASFAAVAVLSPVFYPWYALTPLTVLGASIVSEAGQRWLATAGTALVLLVLPNGLGIAALTRVPGAILVMVGSVALLLRWVRREGGPRQLARTRWRLRQRRLPLDTHPVPVCHPRRLPAPTLQPTDET